MNILQNNCIKFNYQCFDGLQLTLRNLNSDFTFGSHTEENNNF